MTEQIVGKCSKCGGSDGYHTFDELYEFRHVLFISMCKLLKKMKPWRSLLHFDGSSYDGWFIVGIGASKGDQITFHMPMRLWNDCDFMLTVVSPPEWDGHTSSDVLNRIKELPTIEME